MSLEQLPTETLILIFAHVHPNYIAPISRLNRVLYAKVYGLWFDFLFARTNLMNHICAVKGDFLTMIRAKRTLNFHVLPLSYHAAFLSIFGLSMKSIDHFEVSFDPYTFDASFTRRGIRILPAVKLAQQYKFMKLEANNAYLLSLFASMFADIDLLTDSMEFKTIDKNTIFSWASSSLIVAANYGHQQIMERICPHDASAHSFYPSTLSVALIAACEKGQLEAVQYLITCEGTDVKHNKNSALVTSVTRGNLALVKLLMETGCCDASDQDNKCILVACSKSFTEIVELLLFDGRVDPAANGNAPILAAVEAGNLRIVKALMNTGRVDAAVGQNRLIQIACAEGFTQIVEVLLQDPGVNPMVKDCDAFIRACKGGYLEIAEMLVAWTGPEEWEENKVNPAAQSNAAIIYASRHGHASVVEFLLRQPGVNPSVSNNLPLFEACANGHLPVIQRLSTKNLKLEQGTLTRCLEMSSKNGHVHVLQFLAKNYTLFQSSISAKCLLAACERGHVGVVDFFMGEWVCEFHPQTLARALAGAAQGNHVGVVKRLVDVNVVYSFGPALVKAAGLGHTEVVSAVLSSGRKVVVPHEAVMSAKDKGIKMMLQAAIGKRGA
ncbi:hypothetical protein HDU79_005891 [Rhizoclosmatium sp. JEL0117]|nr:hypothetical protein HDU79_005891 [Rhizoclosmatium sp. JEL0117]